MRKYKAIKLLMVPLAALLLVPSVVSAKTSTGTITENRFSHEHLTLNRLQETKQASIQSVKSVDANTVNDRQIIVKLANGSTIDFASFSVVPVDTAAGLAEHQIQIVKVDSNVDYNRALSALRKSPSVISADPDFKKEVKFMPSDPMVSNEWFLNTIHLPEAWDVTQGLNTTIVAVLDTGVNNHADLQGKLLPGYDFVNDDSNPSDDYGHGTHVAGIIAANANNNQGGVGVAFNTKILPVKVADANGLASDSAIAEGIYYAIDHGADVINMSLGGPGYDSVVDQAVWDAYDAGVVLVAAAGNEESSTPDYPASYVPVISVSATDENGQLAYFSNWGDLVDVAAPGVNILGPKYTGGYESDDGTSFSAPIVSGLAALIKGQHSDWKPEQIEWAMEKGTDQTTGWNNKLGFGRVNAFKALNQTVVSSDKVADNPEQGIALKNRTAVSESINMPMDIDFYRFDVAEKSNATIQLNNVPNALDLAGELFKYTNGQWTEVQSVDDNGIGEVEDSSVQLVPGKYALAVYDYNNHWSTASYKVEVSTVPFLSDIKGHWAESEIDYLLNDGLISGYPNATFQPNHDITRAEAAKIIATELKLASVTPNYSDVSSSNWAAGFIGASAKAGIMSGYDNGKFAPNQNLSRAEMATILARAYHLSGQVSSEFHDVSSNYWAFDAIQALKAKGITNGYADGTFRPKNQITRAEFSVMLARVLDSTFKK